MLKKILIFSTVIACVLSADSEWVRLVGTSDVAAPPRKEVVLSATDEVQITTTVFGFTAVDTTVDGIDFKRLTIPGEPVDWDTSNIGKPQIPFVVLTVAVPDSAGMDISIEVSDHSIFEQSVLYPVPRIEFSVSDSLGWVTAEEVYVYDAAFYQKDTVYPGKLFELVNDGHWRGQRVLTLHVYPLQFNPAQQYVHLLSDLWLSIKYTGDIVENECGLGPFEGIGKRILLNYLGFVDDNGGNQSPEVHYYSDLKNSENVADYIIVTHSNFFVDDAESTKIHEFAQWRVDYNSYDVGIVTIQDIYQQFDDFYPDSARMLRHFLNYAYEKWLAPSWPDSHFAYGLLIGDWDFVPADTFMYYLGTGEPDHLVSAEGYYRDIDDYDDVASHDLNGWEDVMLGRWPAKPAVSQQAESVVIKIIDKTINYEMSPNQGDWRRRGLLAGWDAGIDPSAQYLTDIEYDTLTVRESQYGYPEFRDMVKYYWDHGEIIMAYWGHGGHLGWQDFGTHNLVGSLENGDRLPLVLSYSCNGCNFLLDHPYYDGIFSHHWDTCFAEGLLWNENGGAVAVYGAAAPLGLWNYNIEPVERIFQQQIWTIGNTLINNVSMLQGNEYQIVCLIGDPALDMGDFTAFPELPDLVVRPRGFDVELGDPFPYPVNGDMIPITISVWNIGAVAAQDIDVKIRLKVPLFADTATVAALTIDEIGPRDSVTVQVIWDPTVYHLDNGQTIVLPDDFEGEIGSADFCYVVDPDNEITESWEGNNCSYYKRNLVLYPSESNWPRAITPPVYQPVIADLNNDEMYEIVIIDNGILYVLNADGTNMPGWPQPVSGGGRGCVVGDVNDDGYQDIIVAGGRTVEVFDYLGNTLPGWPVQIPDIGVYNIHRLPSLGKIANSNQQQMDIIILADPSGSPHGIIGGEAAALRILVYNNQGVLLYPPFETQTQFTSMKVWRDVAAAVSDVDDDGDNDIIFSYYNTSMLFGRTEIFDKHGFVRSFEYGGDYMTAALADVSNPADDIPDMIVGGTDWKLRAYDVKNDILVWERWDEGAINSAPSVGDIYPSPYEGIEIASGNDAGFIGLREKDAGDPLPYWPYHVVPFAAVRTSPAIATLDGDRYLDLLVAANSGYVYGLQYDRDVIEPYPLPVYGIPSSPVVGDIDGDRKTEVVLASSDGYLHVWEHRDSRVVSGLCEWPQYHHDYQRTGVYGWTGRVKGGQPNPGEFSTATVLSFELEDAAHVRVRVYDADGEVVKHLVDQELSAGTYNPVWDGTDDDYVVQPEGVYFVEYRVKQERKVVPVVIAR